MKLEELTENDEEYKWEEDGFIMVSISEDISWQSIEAIMKKVKSLGLKEQEVSWYVGRGDDIPNTVRVKKSSIESLRKELGDDIIDTILNDWPGPNEYS